MSARGTELLAYCVSPYFIEIPFCASYLCDAQKSVTEGYFDIHSRAGWNLISDLPQQFGRIVLWGKEYAQIDPVPEIYTDKSERLDCARRLLLINLKLALYWLSLGGIQLYVGLSSLYVQRIHQTFWLPLTVFWLIMMVLYLHILYLSVRSYRREKRKITVT